MSSCTGGNSKEGCSLGRGYATPGNGVLLGFMHCWVKKDASRFTFSVAVVAESVLVALCKVGRQEEDFEILAIDLAFFHQQLLPSVSHFRLALMCDMNYFVAFRNFMVQ